MHDMVKRHQVQVLRAAGHTQADTAAHAGVSVASVRRIEQESQVVSFDDDAERKRRKVGRPSKVEPFRALVVELCGEKDSEGNPLQAKEIVRRLRAKGYEGAKSAVYALIASLRPDDVKPLVRFEGVPGEFCQHDFGEVDVKFADGTKKRIHFFASRLKYSRYARVTIVDNQQTETLARCLVQHYDELGGVPLLGVFDRPKTVAISWAKDGTVTQWNRVFVDVMVNLSVGIEVCWPYSGNQKGSVERIVGWVKNSFFKQRSFLDEANLHEQLDAWLVEINTRTPSRATGVIPETRRQEELKRMRPLKVKPSELALRLPVVVGPTGYVTHEKHDYQLPAAAIGIAGTLFLHQDRVHIVVGQHQVVYPRPPAGAPPKRHSQPHLRSEMVAAVSGKRGRLYLKREHLLELGQPALDFLTEVVHRKPRTWAKDVERLHDLLLEHDEKVLFDAFKLALERNTIGVEYVAHYVRVAKAKAAAEAGGGVVVDINAGGTRGAR